MRNPQKHLRNPHEPAAGPGLTHKDKFIWSGGLAARPPFSRNRHVRA